MIQPQSTFRSNAHNPRCLAAAGDCLRSGPRRERGLHVRAARPVGRLLRRRDNGLADGPGPERPRPRAEGLPADEGPGRGEAAERGQALQRLVVGRRRGDAARRQRQQSRLRAGQSARARRPERHQSRHYSRTGGLEELNAQGVSFSGGWNLAEGFSLHILRLIAK